MILTFPHDVLLTLLTNSPPQGEDLEEERTLEEQRRAVMDKYKYKRRQVRELQEDLDAMSRTYDNLSAEEATITGQVDRML